MLHRSLWAIALLLLLTIPAGAAGEDDLVVRVIDVGAGLATVTKLPNGHFVVYDAGEGQKATDSFEAVLGEHGIIDLLILSHADDDHIGAVAWLLDNYQVLELYRGGTKWDTKLMTDRRGRLTCGSSDRPNVWSEATCAIRTAGHQYGTVDHYLRDEPVSEPIIYDLGGPTLTIIAGWHDPHSEEDWDLKGKSERDNGGSIIARLEYENRAVLFTGDTVGRHLDADEPADDEEALESIDFAEEYVVQQSHDYAEANPNLTNICDIAADVLIAPHHGADNGSSNVFIREVDPEFVVFSCGNSHNHPRRETVARFNAILAPDPTFLRTDRGHNACDDKEWCDTRVRGRKPDKAGDDDIEIVLYASGDTPSVEYVNAAVNPP